MIQQFGRHILRSSSRAPLRSMHTRPRLPVPDLHKTLQRYLKSIEPFLREDEARGGPLYEASLQRRSDWADKFANGIGKLCQERLLALDKESPHNWLEDNFWTKKTYHEWRAPLLINSNWWLAFHDDENIPREVLSGRSHHNVVGITPWQTRRSAWLVCRTLEFRDKLASQAADPDTNRTGIWLRESAANMFNFGRIPQAHCDTFSEIPSLSHPDAKKLVVMLHDWLYAVDVYDAQSKLLPVAEIERRLRSVVEDVKRRREAGDIEAVPVGLLTADDRDLWAKNLQHLLSLSTKNHETHQIILRSIMCLSLEHYSHMTPLAASSDSWTSSQNRAPVLNSPAEIDAHLHNIRSGRNAHNRWFDKPYTLIVESNTSAGAMGEHSPVDALVPSIVAEYAVVQGVQEDVFDNVSCMASEDAPTSVGWKRLDWVVDDKIRLECLKAEERAKMIIDNSDDSVLWFTGYGSNWIKDVAKFSSDAFVQMALQLAWYKTRGEFTATYETALTRMFDRGRTETIRALTTDSAAFVLAMIDPSRSASEQRRLLQRAIQTHTSLTREAATGRGLDRHLLGLQLMLRPDDAQPELFTDELFHRSQRWQLSTSGLSAGHHFRGTGFGAAYDDGYGINYLVAPDIIKFGIESKHSSHLTSTSYFKDVIIKVLEQMRSICSTDLGDVVIGGHL